MFSKPIRFSLLTLWGISLALPAVADDTTPRGPLAERLENLRRNLTGENNDPSTDTTPRPRATNAPAKGYQPTRSRPAAEAAPAAPSLAEPEIAERTPRRVTRPAQPADLATPSTETTSTPDAGLQSTPTTAAGASSSRSSGLVDQEHAAAPARVRRYVPAVPVEPAVAPSDASVAPLAAAPSTSSAPAAAPVEAAPKPIAAAIPAVASTKPAGDGVLFSRKGPMLRLETIGPPVTVMGKEAVYKVRIQNMGEAAADGVSVQVQLPDWIEVTATQPSRGTARPPEKGAAGMIVQWQVDSCGAGATEEMVLRLIPRKNQRFDLAAALIVAPSSSQAAIEVREPKLELTISGPSEVLFGDTKTYRLTISNPGSGDAEQVAIQLMPIDGGSQPAASQSLGTILAGQSKVLEIELTARQAGNIHIKAMATGDCGLKANAVEEVLVRRAGLKVAVGCPPVKYAGTPATYVVQVTNPGNAPANKVMVEATLPAGAQRATATSGGTVSADGTKVVWQLDALSAGQQQTLQVTTTLSAPGANQMRVTATAPGDLADSGTAVTTVEAVANLKLELSDPAGPVAVGDETTYEVRIRNRGTTGATNVEVVGFFGEGVEPVRTQGAPGRIGPGQVIFQPIPSVAAGGEIVLRITAKASRPGNHVFRAEVRCKTLGTQLIGEETTLFYPAGGSADSAREAALPASPSAVDYRGRALTR
ncbi:MAG: DUF11 domain-containing protein [Planctomycetia bacterium]|nr:DUF11 domain-containing protein [Planctomycetia bacterium]